MASNGHWITDVVRDIDDFPTKGVSFRDITPLLGDGKCVRAGGRRAGRSVRRRQR